MSTEYYQNLSTYIKQHDLEKANRVVMKELANMIVKKHDEFLFMLNNAGIEANENMTDVELVDLFLENIHNNKKLLLGTAFLISHNNKLASFDGDLEHSEEGLRATHKVLYNYFDADYYDNFCSAEGDEQTSNVGGFGQAIAGAVGEVSKLGSGIIESKRAQKMGATDLFKKKQESKDTIVQGILAQRQAQLIAAKTKSEQKGKNIRTALIVVGGVAIIGITIAIVYTLKKKK